MPPCRCWAACTTRWAPSAAQNLAIMQLVVGVEPSDSRHAACQRGEADRLGVDVGVGHPLAHRLEGAELAAELLPLATRTGGDRSASSQTPIWVAQMAAARDRSPGDDLSPVLRRADASRRDATPSRLTVHCGSPLTRALRRGDAVAAGVDEEHAGAVGRRCGRDEDGRGPVGADHERLLAVEPPAVAVGRGRVVGTPARRRRLARRARREDRLAGDHAGRKRLRCAASLPNSAIGIAAATMLLRGTAHAARRAADLLGDQRSLEDPVAPRRRRPRAGRCRGGRPWRARPTRRRRTTRSVCSSSRSRSGGSSLEDRAARSAIACCSS